VTYLDVMIPALIDPSLAPSGEHIVILTTGPLAPNAAQTPPETSNWRSECWSWQRMSCPPYTTTSLRRTNAVYGWELSPRQVGMKRLPQRTR